jgi:predicted ATPase/DNA-binding SARP family transcriptional activator
VQVSVLGPLEVRDDAGGLVSVSGARLRDLITRLALAGGQPVGTLTLAEAVWGAEDPPADLANALQTLVSRARRVLGGAAIVEQSAAGYRLAITPDDVDALRFERLLAQGSLASAASMAAVTEALALWRGPALADVGDFAAPHAARLHRLRLDALVAHIGGEIDAGGAAAHVAELESLVALHPLNEKFTALLMRALAATGRQADALAVHEALRARLADELGIDPGPHVQAAHLEVLRGEIPPAAAAAADGGTPSSGRSTPASPGRTRTNLRASLTSFIGREHEVARVGAALNSYRLVTLVGPGGAGKTRLASEVAAQVAGRARDGAPDGVWMAELASVTDAADVPHAVLGSIGLRESRLVTRDSPKRITARDAQSQLLEGLAEAHALLVLDNCEHLIDACAQLADTLLAHSPRLRIVATSREPLGITGESLFVVPPLEQDPAVRLFADRAAAVSPAFSLDEESLPLVVDIVRRLDGLPLAIELAAARLRTLPLAEISRRLDDRFRLLTGGSRTALPRHRTLRAVVEWSWDLLTPAERLLAERFSVFPAGATSAAVPAVCGCDGPDVADTDELLSSLVDKSLVQLAADGTRFRMLETIREFGSERLAQRGEISDLRRRHATYYSDLAAQAAPILLTRDQVNWLPVITAERDNLLGALRYWGDIADANQAFALALSACVPALLLGQSSEMTAVLELAWNVPGEADPDLRTIIDAMHTIISAVGARDANEVPPGGAAQEAAVAELTSRVYAVDIERYPLAGLLRPVVAMFAHDKDRVRQFLQEAQASGDEWLAAATWMITAAFYENDGDIAGMRAAGAQALARFQALGERWGLASALRIDGELRILDGDLDGAVARFAEAGAALREIGSHDDESHMAMRLAGIAIRRGDYDTARELYRTIWEQARGDGLPLEQAMAATWTGMFDMLLGNVDRARQMYVSASHQYAMGSAMNAVRHHVRAMMESLGLLIALADGDVPLARERAALAYQAGVDSTDMPLLATAGWALTDLAIALGQFERAARILGAATAVRGVEDPGDPTIARLTARLREALGDERYASAYGAGKTLDRAAAIKCLDPASLLPELPGGLVAALAMRARKRPGRGLAPPGPASYPPGSRPADVGAQRQREEHHEQPGDPREGPRDRHGHRAAQHQAAHRADQVRDRVHVHEGLQPAGHRGGSHERVAAERQRQDQQEHHSLDGAGGADLHADPHRDPGERQREADRYADRRQQRQRAGRDAEAQYVAEADHDHAQQQVPEELREHRAHQRRGPGDRQRPEPVEDALGDVAVHVLPDRDAAHRDRLAEQSRQQELQVVMLRAATQRPAEDVGEQHQEDDRLQRHVDQLLRRAGDLDQVALGEDHRVPQRAEPRPRGRPGRRDLGPGRGRGRQRGHAATSSVSWVRVPVRVKKTSSRLGRCRENSSTAMPAARSRATTSGSTSSPSTRTVSVPRPSPCGARPPRASISERIWRRSSWRAGSVGRTVSRCPPTTRLRPFGVSCAMTLPWLNTVISSASASASSRYCVVSSTVEPSLTRLRTTSHMSSRLAGSRPVVGSSRKITDGRPTREAARSSRRRIPPE